MPKEEQYYINFYRNDSNEKIRGNWKLTEEETETERTSYLYTTKLSLRWEATASISRAEVKKMAVEHNMSVAEVLDCV